MIKITGLKASADQSLTIADPNGGGPIKLRLVYRPRLQEWFIDIEFGAFILNGFRLALCPNRLSQFVNRVPFGLAVITTYGLDPFLINDFSSGTASLYLLTAEEVAQVAADIYAGVITG